MFQKEPKLKLIFMSRLCKLFFAILTIGVVSLASCGRKEGSMSDVNGTWQIEAIDRYGRYVEVGRLSDSLTDLPKLYFDTLFLKNVRFELHDGDGKAYVEKADSLKFYDTSNIVYGQDSNSEFYNFVFLTSDSTEKQRANCFGYLDNASGNLILEFPVGDDPGPALFLKKCN